jgi:hypothetical protein
MAITAALTEACAEVSGGIKRVYLTDKANVASFTLTGDSYSAITMVGSAVFYEFQFKEFMAERRETASMSDSGTIVVTRELEMFFKGLSATNRTRLQELNASSTCGMIAICEDQNGTLWVDGYNERFKLAMKVQTITSVSGKTFEDASGSTVILANKNNEFSRTLNSGVTIPV